MAMKYLTPGPVQLPKMVIDAIARQPQFHRTDEFRATMRMVLEKLSKVYPYGQPIVMPGTGTFAVDVMVYNYIEPGDNVLVISMGEFGERLSDSIESRGAKVIKLEYEIGGAPSLDVVEDTAKKYDNISAIAVVHNETSAGVTYRYIEKLQDVAYSVGAILLVDSVSALPAEPIKSRVDVIATASQKAFLAPPGAAILYVSREPRAKTRIPPSMDLTRYLKGIHIGDTPYTPPINVVYGLDASLDYILGMGIDQYHAVHRERAYILYTGLKLKPVPRDPYLWSYTVTAFYTEKGAGYIVRELKKHGYVIASGMGRYKDSIIRIGVMGDIAREDLEKVVEVVNSLVDQ